MTDHEVERALGYTPCVCGVVDEHDIVECSRCGKQWTVPCSFDEDYS